MAKEILEKQYICFSGLGYCPTVHKCDFGSMLSEQDGNGMTIAKFTF